MTSQPYWRCWPRVADPRHRRGVRHRLAVILGLALCAVVAGARSFTATAEWAADADEQTLYMLRTGSRVPSGIDGGPCSAWTRIPSISITLMMRRAPGTRSATRAPPAGPRPPVEPLSGSELRVLR
jgi:DDE_Tnp_1-associated